PQAPGPEGDDRRQRVARQGRHQRRRRAVQGRGERLRSEVQERFHEEVTLTFTKERETAMRSQKVVRRIAATVAVAAMTAIGTGIPVLRAADKDKSETLIYAVYNGQDTATQVYKTMQQNQSSTGERIEAYAVVSKDLKGKVRVRDQRKRDSGIGAV